MMEQEEEEEEPPSKRLRNDNNVEAVIPFSAAPRTSSLPSPTIKLTGHTGSIYALQYSADGDTLVSASFDMTCLLWDRYYANYNVLKGHKNAILDVKFSSPEKIATASADKTIGWWSGNTGERIKKLQGHNGIVNAVDTIKSGYVSCSVYMIIVYVFVVLSHSNTPSILAVRLHCWHRPVTMPPSNYGMPVFVARWHP